MWILKAQLPGNLDTASQNAKEVLVQQEAVPGRGLSSKRLLGAGAAGRGNRGSGEACSEAHKEVEGMLGAECWCCVCT